MQISLDHILIQYVNIRLQCPSINTIWLGFLCTDLMMTEFSMFFKSSGLGSLESIIVFA